jgi:hypothetical protein
LYLLTHGDLQWVCSVYNSRVNASYKHIPNFKNLGFLRGAQVTLSNLHSNLNGHQLRVAHPPTFLGLLVMPWFYAGKISGTENFYYEGTDVRILQMISQQMNFGYIFHETVDGAWGAPGANGSSWTGMIGMVQRHVSTLK